MTRPKKARKPGCCPHCLARLKSLHYTSHQSITGEFSLAAGHEQNLEPDQDRIEYCCPECGVILFAEEALAETFLLGQKTPLTLRGKNKAKPEAAAKR